jgi:hypothetical protein
MAWWLHTQSPAETKSQFEPAMKMVFQMPKVNLLCFVKVGIVFFLIVLFHECLAQNESNLRAGVYSGFQLGAFQESAYPSSPHPGWKAGLQLSYELNPGWKFTGEAGVSFLNCHVKNPMMPASIRWKYLWAEAAPLLSYVPIQRGNFNIVIGSGISVRRILSSSVAPFYARGDSNNERLYPWTYFLPIRLSSTTTLANRHSLTFSAEYSRQLRRMYRAGDDNLVSTTINRMYSWGFVVSYSVPTRGRANKA